MTLNETIPDELIRLRLKNRYPDFTEMFPGMTLDHLSEENRRTLYHTHNLSNITPTPPKVITIYENIRQKNPRLFDDNPEFSLAIYNTQQLEFLASGPQIEFHNELDFLRKPK